MNESKFPPKWVAPKSFQSKLNCSHSYVTKNPNSLHFNEMGQAVYYYFLCGNKPIPVPQNKET
jgi:hypothetical protein